MGLITLPPEVKTMMESVEAFREDISEVRRLLERLVELEEQKV